MCFGQGSFCSSSFGEITPHGAPFLFAEGAIAASTTGALTVTLPAHQSGDVLIVSLGLWAPNSPDFDVIAYPAGWTLLSNYIAEGSLDGIAFWIAKAAESSSETNPSFTLPVAWDTGTDTCFAGRAYTIRGAAHGSMTIGANGSFDETDINGAYTAANQNMPGMDVNGEQRTGIVFGVCMDNTAFSMAPTGWTPGLEVNDTTGTDCAFQTARKENINASTSETASVVSAVGTGYYCFMGISFKKPFAQTISADGIASAEAFGSLARHLDAPYLFREGAVASNTSGSLTVTLPEHATNDIIVLALGIWAPNSLDDEILEIPTPSGYTAIVSQVGDGPGADVDGWVAWFYKVAASSSETNPVCTRGAGWDTGTDTCFAGRAYVVRNAAFAQTPWDFAVASNPYTTANQNGPVTQLSSGASARTAIQFGISLDDQAFSMVNSGWDEGTAASTTTGTDASFQTIRKDDISAAQVATTPSASAPAQGFYAYLGVTFRLPAFNQGISLDTGANGIASAEAFGTASINPAISPSGIASAEAFGTAQLNQQVVCAGIASTEAFGTASIGLSISPSGIASTEAFGTPQLNQQINCTGVASAEAFGTPQLNQQINCTGIASAEAFGTPSVETEAQLVSPSGIPSAEAFGTPQLNQQIRATGVASAEAFGTAQLNLQIVCTGIASAGAFGTPQLNQQINCTGIPSAEAVGTASVRSSISPSGIPSAEAFGTATLNQQINTAGIASAEAFGTTSVRPLVYAVGIPTAEAFGTLTLNFSVFPVGVVSAEAFGVGLLFDYGDIIQDNEDPVPDVYDFGDLVQESEEV